MGFRFIKLDRDSDRAYSEGGSFSWPFFRPSFFIRVVVTLMFYSYISFFTKWNMFFINLL